MLWEMYDGPVLWNQGCGCIRGEGALERVGNKLRHPAVRVVRLGEQRRHRQLPARLRRDVEVRKELARRLPLDADLLLDRGGEQNVHQTLEEAKRRREIDERTRPTSRRAPKSVVPGRSSGACAKRSG